jgi:hypothetical protein
MRFRLAATIATLLALGAFAAPAPAATFAPQGRAYFGTSDTGQVYDYFTFSKELQGAHPAVLQTFHLWGTDPVLAIDRWHRTRTIGMLSIGTSDCYACPGIISTRQITLGYGDEYPLMLARRLTAAGGFHYIRLFPEMNGHWNAYSAFDQSGASRPDNSTHWFKAAWKRFAVIIRGGSRREVNARLRRLGQPKLMRADSNDEYERLGVPRRLPQAEVALMWVPQTTGSPNVNGNSPRDYWPGGRWVDWVGADIYAKFPNFSGLERFYRDFRRKPFLIGEWSPWDNGSPSFVAQLFNWAESHRRTKLLVYYQGFGGPGDPHRIHHWPAAKRRLNYEVNDLSRFDPYGPGLAP